MPRKSTSGYAERETRTTRTNRGFTELVRGVPVEQFIRMVTKSGLPAQEAKELCAAFKELTQ